MLTRIARYEPVTRLVDDVAGSTLLEVGSGSRGIRPFVGDRWAITSADTDFSDYGARFDIESDRTSQLRASVLDLPLANGAFDVVVAVDLLEHLRSSDRVRALQEMARVARVRLIVACPCGEQALDADRRLARYYGAIRRTRPGWLDEHLANGFPEVAEIASSLEPFGTVTAIANERITFHLAVSFVEATPLVWAVSPLVSKVLTPVIRASGSAAAPARWLSRAVRGFDREPTYRGIVVLDVGGASG